MPSAETYLNIVNETPFDFYIQVSGIDSSDWDGVSRPDKNFQNVTIPSGKSNKQRAEINTLHNSSKFTMLLIFSNGDRVSFSNDQFDALTYYDRLYYTDRCWVIHQYSGGSDHNTNNFHVKMLSAPEAGQEDWMSKIHDGVSLTNITIPGTHDSGTSKGGDIPVLSSLVLNSLVRAQNLSITEQLNAGIRFLDIRCHNNGNKFGIRHGPVNIIDTSFDDVLTDCQKFLNDHPKEIILMSVKEEESAENSDMTFAEVFQNSYVEKYTWFKGNDIPTFDHSTRGRIVLINRFDKGFGFGFFIDVVDNDYSDGVTDASHQTYHIQDKYQIDYAGNNKVAQVTGFMGRAQAGERGDLFLNFASGTVGVTHSLSEIADRINPRVEAYAKENAGPFGVVIMDFPPKSLINALIQSNSRLMG